MEMQEFRKKLGHVNVIVRDGLVEQYTGVARYWLLVQ